MEEEGEAGVEPAWQEAFMTFPFAGMTRGRFQGCVLSPHVLRGHP